MRNALVGTTTAVLMLFAPGIVAAQQDVGPQTTAELARSCAAEDLTFCYGFMSGAWQFYEALLATEEAAVEPFVCPTDAVTADEAVAAFTDWATANAARGDETAVDGLFRAWATAYPCNGEGS